MPGRRGNLGGVGATLRRTCSVRRSEPGNGTTDGPPRPPTPGAPRRPRHRRLSAAATSPFHATSSPPSRSSGAAYSQRTGSAASARAQTTSQRPMPSATPRRAPARLLRLPAPWRGRPRAGTRICAIPASTRTMRASGSAAASTSPGSPAPAPDPRSRGARSSDTSRPTSESARCTSIAHGGRAPKWGPADREQVEQDAERAGGAAAGKLCRRSRAPRSSRDPLTRGSVSRETRGRHRGRRERHTH